MLLNMEQTFGGRLLVGRTMQSEWWMEGKWLCKSGQELSFLWQSELAVAWTQGRAQMAFVNDIQNGSVGLMAPSTWSFMKSPPAAHDMLEHVTAMHWTKLIFTVNIVPLKIE